MMKTITLIGMMGTGKTTIATHLAKKLNLPHIDTDLRVTQNTQMSINDIFAQKGEEYFRTLETEILTTIPLTNTIVSCGGGLVLAKKNRVWLKNSYVILLNAKVETLIMRLANDTTRPLLTKNLRSKIYTLLNERKALYVECANLIIETDNKTVAQIVTEIERIITSRFV